MILASIQENGFCAYGDHILKKEHLIRRMDAPELTNLRNITFIMNPEIQEVEDGFFTLLPKIKKLVIKNPECKIRLDSETISLFRKNDVLICGVFDGIAEKIAREQGLKFLHTEILLSACGELDSPHGCETKALCFRDNGEAYIRITENSRSFGGELQHDLPTDFYWHDIDYFAQEWGGRFADDIKQNEELMVLLRRAKNKGGCYIDYAKHNEDGSIT